MVTPEQAGWAYSGLRVLELAPGAAHSFATGADELLVMPLEGGGVVECESRRFELAGRDGVFGGVTDFAYVPRDAEVRVSSGGGGRFILPSARATSRLDPAYGPAEAVPVELRGAGQASRQVNNFCTPASFPADKMIVVEVLTPGGNWSSYPPHKHDEQRADEVELEEIYYFEVAGDGGLGYQRVYSSGPGPPDRRARRGPLRRRGAGPLRLPRAVDGRPRLRPVLPERDGRPAAERAWRFCDDPAHAWVRGTWDGQEHRPPPAHDRTGRQRMSGTRGG